MAGPLVGVVMGSRSDWDTMQHCVEQLGAFGVPCEVRVLSAHRTPRELAAWVTEAEERGIDYPWRDGCTPDRITETERGLLDALSMFPTAIAKVGKTLRVSQLTEYAFELATSFTTFYEHPDPDADVQTLFIHIQDQNLQTFRLSLVGAFKKVMADVLTLMGMPTLEKI